MIDHVSLAVRDLVASARASNACWPRWALCVLWSVPARWALESAIPSCGSTTARARLRCQPDTGAHVCLRAPDEGAVRAFHAAALAGGCKDAGAPGPRQAAITMYFGHLSSTKMATRFVR